METKKKNGKFYLALVIFSLVGQVAWVVENMYLNVFIYKMFQATPEAISAMVAASAVAATVTTLLIGALSDKVGKRKLFICGGYILWGISIWSFAVIRLDVINALFPAVASAASLGVTLVIVMDCVMTFFGSSANDACFNAWLTDSTNDTNRGLAEGINAMMPLVAILAVFGGFMGVNQDLADSWTLIFAPAIILAAVFTGLYGQVYDKKGFRTAIVLPMVLLMAGYVILYLTRHTVPVFIGSVLMMCGFLGTGAILGAKVRTHTPENRSGMFQGLRIVGQVLIPGVVGPYIGKMILQNAQMITNSDGTQSFLPNANIFLGALVAIAFAWVVMIPLMKKEK